MRQSEARGVDMFVESMEPASQMPAGPTCPGSSPVSHRGPEGVADESINKHAYQDYGWKQG